MIRSRIWQAFYIISSVLYFDRECTWQKVKLSRNKSWRLRRRTKCWASIPTLTFDTIRTTKLSALRAGRTLPPRKFLGTHLLDAEWTPGLMNAGRRNISLESFQGPYWKSNTEPPVLWRSASNDCSILSLTSVLDGGRWSMPRLGRFTPGNDSVPIV
jgi:hypothetical protein